MSAATCDACGRRTMRGGSASASMLLPDGSLRDVTICTECNTGRTRRLVTPTAEHNRAIVVSHFVSYFRRMAAVYERPESARALNDQEKLINVGRAEAMRQCADLLESGNIDPADLAAAIARADVGAGGSRPTTVPAATAPATRFVFDSKPKTARKMPALFSNGEAFEGTVGVQLDESGEIVRQGYGRIVSNGAVGAQAGPSKRVPMGLRLLKALSQRGRSATPEQLAVGAGVSVKGGAFAKAWRDLKRDGLVVRYFDSVTLSPAGEEAVAKLGGAPLPKPGPDLVAYWVESLPEMHAAILNVYAAEYPELVSRETVGEVTGYSHYGGAFLKACRKLRALGLVDGDRASASLMGG
jgi:hypothetical protein